MENGYIIRNSEIREDWILYKMLCSSLVPQICEINKILSFSVIIKFIWLYY